MVRITIFVVLSLIATILYCLGLIKFLTDTGEDRCEMTYMFEYPQYVRISNNIDKKYRKYGLYAYSEGRLTMNARSMFFSGIPVLFIPGNAGSYKQVRSISSVALRKAISDNSPYHFDYFTIDLNDELSGLYGPLLYDQLDYVNASFYRIFELYKGSMKPESMVIIGHSMGGIVAKNLMAHISNPKLISILITLAAPLRRPVVVFDHYLQSFYDRTNENVPESTTTVVSLAGGYRDFLIPPFLSRKKDQTSLYAITSTVPRSWVECNHVQILWCKQIVLALNRALFDSIGWKTRQISENSTYRNLVFNHHLVHNSGIKIANIDYYSEKAELFYKGKWIENVQKQYSIEHMRGMDEAQWYMVKLNILPGYEILNILAINLDTINWVYLCNANVLQGSAKKCSTAYRLTHLSEIIPSIKYKRRYFQINLHELRRNHSDLTHVVFRGLPTREPLVFHVDIHGSEERDIQVDLPGWWSTRKHVVIERTADKAIHYKLILSRLYYMICFYQLFVEPSACTNENHHASAVLMSTWSNEKTEAYFTTTERKPLNIRLYSSRTSTDAPYIKLTLDPSCTYHISMRTSFFGTLGQVARLYTPLLLTYISLVVLMSLKYQLRSFKSGKWPVLFSAIQNGAKPYYLLTFTKIVVQVVRGRLPNWMPMPDNWYLQDDGLDFVILPLVLYLCAVGIVWMATIGYAVSLFALESTIHKLTIKLLNRTFIWSNYLMSVFNKIPGVVALLLIMISTTICGSLALCLGVVFYFMRLTQMSQDFVEDTMWFFVKTIAKKLAHLFRKKRSQAQVINKESNQKKLLGISASNTNDNLDVGIEDKDVNEVPVENVDNAEEKMVHAKQETNNSKKPEEDIEEDSTENVSESNEVGDASKASLGLAESENPPASMEETMASNLNPIFFHTTMFYLWCLIAIINIPAVLTWVHNFKYNKSLSPDTSFIPGVSLSLCALPLWQMEFPRNNRKWLEHLENIVFFVAVLSLAFGTISVYRLNYLLTFVFILVVLQQLLAPKIEGDSGAGDDDKDKKEDEARAKYEEIKAKLD